MNKSIIFMFSAAMAWTACGNNQGKLKNEVKPQMEQQVSQDTAKQVLFPSMEDSLLVQQVEVLPSDTAGGTRKLTRNDFLNLVWNYEKSPKEWIFLGRKPAIIDFYADWCGPCRIASPILEEVSYEFAGRIVVYKIDTEKEQELAAVFGVQSIPAFLYIPTNGKPVMMAGIARTKEDTKQMFIDNINKFLLPVN
jgi:thioredoxin